MIKFEFCSRNGKKYQVEVDYNTYTNSYLLDSTFTDIEGIEVFDSTTGLQITKETDHKVLREIEREIEFKVFEDDFDITDYELEQEYA